MKFSMSILAQKDRLTDKELNGLDSDEWIALKAVRDYILDGEAEMMAWAEARSDADALGQPPPTSLASTRVWRWRFEYMFIDWNLYEPADDETQAHGVPIEKTPAEREKFFRIYGAQLTAAMLMRGGGIAGVLVREVGPDGEKADFRA